MELVDDSLKQDAWGVATNTVDVGTSFSKIIEDLS